MQLRGTGVGRGIAIAPILRMPDPLPDPEPDRHDGDPQAEFEAVADALAAVAADLRDRARLVDGDARAMLEAAATMAEDPMLADEVRARIAAGSSGQRALFEASARFQETLRARGGRFAELAADLADVSRRALARLRDAASPAVPTSDTPFILVARDLAPADTALLDPAKVHGLITSEGGPASHTAILARQRGIVAIVAVAGALDLRDGTLVIADADAGTVTVEPGAAEAEQARASVRERDPAPGGPIAEGALADGTKVPLLANVGSADEAVAAVDLGAEGVGLVRTEFLFLGASEAPDVVSQQASYEALFSHFSGRTVIARTFDAGGDKPLGFLEGGGPASGLRGLRALRQHERVLRDQLAALKAAQDATGAELRVMAPMVADAEETAYFVTLGRELGLDMVGVMAEVPSLAVLADQVFVIADFVSIGTNDLTQFTLAADRTNGRDAGHQDPWHPAVLRLVKLIGDAGAAAGKPVSVCGEAAADPDLAVVLVGLGATSLSMAPVALADVRSRLQAVTLDEARAMAAAAMTAKSPGQARRAAARA